MVSAAEQLAANLNFGAFAKAEDLKKRTKELTEGRGADVVYDAVGGEYAEPAIRATA